MSGGRRNGWLAGLSARLLVCLPVCLPARLLANKGRACTLHVRRFHVLRLYALPSALSQHLLRPVCAAQHARRRRIGGRRASERAALARLQLQSGNSTRLTRSFRNPTSRRTNSSAPRRRTSGHKGLSTWEARKSSAPANLAPLDTVVVR